MIKLIVDKIVKKYEFTYLLPDFYTSAEVEKSQKEIEELIKKHKGKVVSTNDWGKKPLAYKIKKQGKTHEAALYTHLIIEFSPAVVQKFEKGLYLNEKVLRHLLVVEEKESQPLKQEVKSEADAKDEKPKPEEKK
jgi:small subunit ribosomal protein S6